MEITPGTEAWYAQVQEEILEPDRPIIDPHHHLWDDWKSRNFADYLLDDLWKDTQSGHKIVKTVFIECHTNYRDTGPDHLKPLGETEFVAKIALQSAATGANKAVISGIVSHMDLRRKDVLEETLEMHQAASQGLLRGIRHAGAYHPSLGDFGPGLFLDETFQEGVRHLGRRGLTYESYHYHTQLRDFTRLARSAPDTTIILDHFGTPLGTGPFRDQREEIFQQWKADMRELAACPNVNAKLGGLAQRDNGFGWHEAARPPTSDEMVAAQKRYYLHTIDCFGPERCMFESNFPVDKISVSYPVLWNAFKKIAADFSKDEKAMMFYGTAARVYQL